MPLGKGERWKTTLTVPATAGLRDLIGREKAVRRRMKARFGARSRRNGCLLTRFYPVQSFSLTLLLWRICHNGKGKAKSVIILMDLPGWVRLCGGRASLQALVNHMGASMGLVLRRTARFPRV
jgi:hypothetical protein